MILSFIENLWFMIFAFLFFLCVFQVVLSGEFAILLKFLHSAFFILIFFPMFVVVNLLRLLLFFSHPS